MHERGTKATGCKKAGEQISGHYMVLSPKLVPEHSATARPFEAVFSLVGMPGMPGWDPTTSTLMNPWIDSNLNAAKDHHRGVPQAWGARTVP